MDKIKVGRAIKDLKVISQTIQLFKLDNGKVPDASLQELVPVYLAGIPLDPWGKEYQYYNHTTGDGNGRERMDGPIHPLNTDCDLYSEGKDGNSTPNIMGGPSKDDIIHANDGGFVGLAKNY